jgi:hypothetical protein
LLRHTIQELTAHALRPEAGRQLCREAIEKHLDLAAIAEYERQLAQHQEQVVLALPDAVEQVLKMLRNGRK